MSHFPRPKQLVQRSSLGFKVPIIGQAFEGHEGFAMATLTCRCKPDNVPLLITHVDVGAVCSGCGNVYGITKVEFDRRKGHARPAVTIEKIGHAEQRESSDEQPAEEVGVN